MMVCMGTVYGMDMQGNERMGDMYGEDIERGTKIENKGYDEEGSKYQLHNVDNVYTDQDMVHADIAFESSTIKTVLVLGSGGLIGRALVSTLKSLGYEVLEVKNRRHVDLRIAHSLEQFECVFSLF